MERRTAPVSRFLIVSQMLLRGLAALVVASYFLIAAPGVLFIPLLSLGCYALLHGLAYGLPGAAYRQRLRVWLDLGAAALAWLLDPATGSLLFVLFPLAVALNALDQDPRRLAEALAGAAALAALVWPLRGGSLDAGAWAYLATVCALLAVVLAQAVERHQLADRLREAAVRDPLTGLLNRAGFAQRVDYLLAMHQRADLPMVTACVVLEGLGRINERFGYGIGDELLRRFAELARGRLRETDLAGRVGGNEFAFVLVDSDPAQAREAMERVAAAFAEWRDARGYQVEVRLASVPVAAQDDRFDEILRRGERALRLGRPAAGRPLAGRALRGQALRLTEPS